jgi:hypothetical protein
MSSEVVEIITAAVDKFLATENYEVRRGVRGGGGGGRAVRSCCCRCRIAHTLPHPPTQPTLRHRCRYRNPHAPPPPPPPPPPPGGAQKASQAIKDGLDKKFGPTWHAVVGEGFAYDITFNSHHMVYLFYGEKLGILVFKC